MRTSITNTNQRRTGKNAVKEDNKKRQQPAMALKTSFYFFSLGVLCLFYDEIIVMAAEDILSGSSFATSTVIIAFSMALLSVKLIAPWFIQNVSYLKRIVVIAILYVSGLLVVVMSGAPVWRLVGISVVQAGTALSEITFLALTTFYDGAAVSAFVAGEGFSSLLGPVLYTALTTWTCLAPKTAVAATIPAVLLLFLFYFLLDKDPIGEPERTEHKGASYTALNEGFRPESHKGPSCAEQFAVAREIYPIIAFLFVVYFAEYLANEAVVTTVAFKNSSFSPRDHYQYYILSYQLGKFLGRSHILIALCTCPRVLPYIRVRRTWILAVVEMAHLLFFLFQSWYRFVPHVAIIIIFCATEGFTAGSMYVNSAHAVADMIHDTKRREFGMGLTTVGNPAGQLAAGLMGLYVEPYLKKHCLDNLHLGPECLTRFTHTHGWTKNIKCS